MEREILFSREYPETDIEWLETDGRGGYASSTVSLCNTRKYHGLYAAGVKGFEGRYLFVSGIEPVIEQGDTVLEFSNSQYPGKIHPEGFRMLDTYRDFPFPSWQYSKDGTVFVIELFLTHNYGLVLKMKNLSEKENPALLKLNFLFSMRNIHHLSVINAGADIVVETDNKTDYSFSCYSAVPPLYICFSKKTVFENSPWWIENTEYLKEMERGFDFREDRIMPGTFSALFRKGDELFCRITLDLPEEENSPDFEKIYAEEKKRREKYRRKFSRIKKSSLRLLKENSRHFIIRNAEGFKSVIAGYPWFGEWGRDSMISLPGLTFFNSSPEEGIEILRGYTNLIKNGLIPNTLSGAQGFESYNSVDASLLYIFAVHQLFRYVRGGRAASVEFYTGVKKIIDAFLSGKHPAASIDNDGFINAGDEKTQLTWMDAMVDNIPVTPRSGAPVDINALWYNALMFLMELSKYMKKDLSDEYASAAEKIRKNFRDKYWIDTESPCEGGNAGLASSGGRSKLKSGYLADSVTPGIKDSSVRPNMLWAVSLPYSPLSVADCRSVVEVCREKLLTSSGLRTLSPEHPDFRGRYSGNGRERDSAYHQGTVWPWLFGIYTEAVLRISENSEKDAEEIELLLDRFLDRHLLKNGRGFISEVFDGYSPENGKGAFAQAWSCAEIIRSYSLIERVRRGFKL